MQNITRKITPASPAAISLLISDVDGVLLDAGGVLLEETRRAVQNLGRAGIAFTLASSRPPHGLRSCVEALDVLVPFAACNGAAILHPNFDVIEQRPLSMGETLRLCQLLRSYGLETWLFTLDHWYVQHRRTPFSASAARAMQMMPIETDRFPAISQDVLKVTGVHKDEKTLAECEARIGLEYPNLFAVSRSQPYCIDITNRDANKGTVVHSLSRLLKLEPNRIAAIGASPDNLPMLQQSGWGITRENAAPEVLAAADRTTSDDAQGFISAINFLTALQFSAPAQA